MITKLQILDACIKSREHHQKDNAEMMKKEFKTLGTNDFKIYTDSCDLCKLFKLLREKTRCSSQCVLDDSTIGCGGVCAKEWQALLKAAQERSYKKFIQSAKNLVSRLDHEIEKLRKEIADENT